MVNTFRVSLRAEICNGKAITAAQQSAGRIGARTKVSYWWIWTLWESAVTELWRRLGCKPIAAGEQPLSFVPLEFFAAGSHSNLPTEVLQFEMATILATNTIIKVMM